MRKLFAIVLSSCAGGGLVPLTACGGAMPSPTAQACIERYAECGSFSTSMQAYVSCRDDVDKDCLPQKDGGK